MWALGSMSAWPRRRSRSPPELQIEQAMASLTVVSRTGQWQLATRPGSADRTGTTQVRPRRQCATRSEPNRQSQAKPQYSEWLFVYVGWFSTASRSTHPARRPWPLPIQAYRHQALYQTLASHANLAPPGGQRRPLSRAQCGHQPAEQAYRRLGQARAQCRPAGLVRPPR